MNAMQFPSQGCLLRAIRGVSPIERAAIRDQLELVGEWGGAKQRRKPTHPSRSYQSPVRYHICVRALIERFETRQY